MCSQLQFSLELQTRIHRSLLESPSTRSLRFSISAMEIIISYLELLFIQADFLAIGIGSCFPSPGLVPGVHRLFSLITKIQSVPRSYQVSLGHAC